MSEIKWLHRIDAVPFIGSNIQFKHLDGRTFEAVTTKRLPGDDAWYGIGDDVRIQHKGGPLHGIVIIPSRNVEFWRYIGPDEGSDKFWDGVG